MQYAKRTESMSGGAPCTRTTPARIVLLGADTSFDRCTIRGLSQKADRQFYKKGTTLLLLVQDVPGCWNDSVLGGVVPVGQADLRLQAEFVFAAKCRY